MHILGGGGFAGAYLADNGDHNRRRGKQVIQASATESAGHLLLNVDQQDQTHIRRGVGKQMEPLAENHVAGALAWSYG
jgi:hypothetical protein